MEEGTRTGEGREGGEREKRGRRRGREGGKREEKGRGEGREREGRGEGKNVGEKKEEGAFFFLNLGGHAPNPPSKQHFSKIMTPPPKKKSPRYATGLQIASNS